MRKNTMSVPQYLFSNMLWTVNIMFWYRAIFETLPGKSYAFSNNVYMILMLVFLSVGVYSTIRSARNIVSVLVTILIPSGIYTFWAYAAYYQKGFAAVAATAAVLCIGSLILRRRFKSRAKRLLTPVQIIRCSAALCSLLVIAVVAIRPPKTVESAVSGEIAVSEWTLENKAPVLESLSDWQELDIKRRMDVLQTVANIEANHFGLSANLPVSAKRLGPVTSGIFLKEEGWIRIDTDHLLYDSAEAVLGTLLHECRHAYQSCVMDVYEGLSSENKNLLLFEEAKNWDGAIEQYKETYEENVLELDARAYADNRIADYNAFLTPSDN